MLTEQPAQGTLTKNAAHMRFRTLVTDPKFSFQKAF